MVDVTSAAARHVIFAMDAFKGTLTSYNGGEAAESGFRAFQAKNANKQPADCTAEPLVAPTTPINFIHCPMSDGGAGLLDSITYRAPDSAKKQQQSATRFDRIFVPASVKITGPLATPLDEFPHAHVKLNGQPVAELPEASFACDVQHRVVVVEMAEASGLPRILDPALRSPLNSTSYGTGEMIRYAVSYLEKQVQAQSKNSSVAEKDLGVRVFIGIGGSSTNDGGLGALQALGMNMYVSPDKNNSNVQLLTTPFCGRHLEQLRRVEISPEMHALFNQTNDGRAYIRELYLICDVNNPLVGPRGATFVFGPQKCAPVAKQGGCGKSKVVEDLAVGEVGSDVQMNMLRSLERGMANAAAVVVRCLHNCHHNSNNIANDSKAAEEALQTLLHAPGGGGAGGISGFFRYVLHASWLPGADAVADLLGLREDTKKRSNEANDDNTRSRGILFDMCNVVVSGEGSFDAQTVDSRKTVGRLLEMAVEANLWRLEKYAKENPTVNVMTMRSRSSACGNPALSRRGSSQLSESSSTTSSKSMGAVTNAVTAALTPLSLIDDFVIICGRCGFKSLQSCQAEILHVLHKRLLRNANNANNGNDANTTTEAVAVKTKNEDTSEAELTATLCRLSALFSSQFGVKYTPGAVLARALPRLTILPLSPVAFTVRQAMTDTYNCVRRRMEACLTEMYLGQETATSRSAAKGVADHTQSKV